MSVLDCQLLRETVLNRDPFDHIIVPRVIRDSCAAEIIRDFPKVDQPGSVPLDILQYGPKFAQMIDEMRGAEFSDAISRKFDIDLSGRPTLITVRGHCRLRDGQIHTDSKNKLVTVLLYLNAEWESGGGRLRLLRTSDDIENFAAEVPPEGQTMLAFKCVENAWHGHKPYAGVRRTIQLNWVTDEAYVRRENRRHRVSTFFKRFGA